MELRAHPLYEDYAIATFDDEEELVVAAKALMRSRNSADRLRGIQLRLRPYTDSLIGRGSKDIVRFYERPTNFRHEQLSRMEEELVSPSEEPEEHELLDTRLIIKAIQNYFGTGYVRQPQEL